MEGQEENFIKALGDTTNNKNCHMKLTFFGVFNALISELKVAEMKTKGRTPRDYYLLKQYEILDCGKSEKLIKKRKTESDQILYHSFDTILFQNIII